MVWTDVKDKLLCREILLCEPYKFKARTKERGNVWKIIANNLNIMADENFAVDQRAVRERFTLIAEKFEKKIKEQEKASGIAPPELSKLEQALEEIISRMKEAQHQVDANDSKIGDDKRKAEDVRQKALETFAQTKKRKSLGLDDDETLTSSKRSRSAGTDTLIYLREKSENDQRLKEEELELKKRKQELLEAQQKAQIDQQKDFMNTVRDCMRQQQQQTQQMMVLMAQMLNTLKKD